MTGAAAAMLGAHLDLFGLLALEALKVLSVFLVVRALLRRRRIGAEMVENRYRRIIDEYNLAARLSGRPDYSLPASLRRTDRDLAWRLASDPTYPPARSNHVRVRRSAILADAIIIGLLVTRR